MKNLGRRERDPYRQQQLPQLRQMLKGFIHFLIEKPHKSKKLSVL